MGGNVRSASFIRRGDLRRQTEAVEGKKDLSVLDEAPGACKDIERVMSDQEDLVEIEAELERLVCVKG